MRQRLFRAKTGKPCRKRHRTPLGARLPSCSLQLPLLCLGSCLGVLTHVQQHRPQRLGLVQLALSLLSTPGLKSCAQDEPVLTLGAQASSSLR